MNEQINEQCILFLFADEDESLETVQEGRWLNDLKWQHREDIVKHTASGTFWEITQSRSGSYWDDYEYADPEARQVVPVKRMVEITEWKAA